MFHRWYYSPATCIRVHLQYDKKVARDGELLLVKAREFAEKFNDLMARPDEVDDEEYERLMQYAYEQAEEVSSIEHLTSTHYKKL